MKEKIRQIPAKSIASIIFLFILILSAGIYYQTEFLDTYQTGPLERSMLKADYSPENESLTIEVTEGNFTSKSSFIALKNGSRNNPKTEPDNDFVLEQDNRTKKTYIWASNAVHHAPWRMEGLPLKEGSSITVVSDGVDSDNDGQKGIENGDKVAVTSYNDGYYGAINTFVIQNDTAVCTLIGNAEEFLTGEISCYE